MVAELREFIEHVRRGHRDEPWVTTARLCQVTDQLMASLADAGTDRRRLLSVVQQLEPAARLLRSCARDQRRARGRTRAVELAESALIDLAWLRYDTGLAVRYMPSAQLSVRLFRAVRAVEQARIALRWEQPAAGT